MIVTYTDKNGAVVEVIDMKILVQPSFISMVPRPAVKVTITDFMGLVVEEYDVL